MASSTPPAGAYSSPCLPPEWMWQYSPEADEVFFIHQPSDGRQWDHPDGADAETAFYQWLGAQLGAGGFSTSPVASPRGSVADGAPLSREFGSFSGPSDYMAPSSSSGGGAAADFYNAPVSPSQYPDGFTPTGPVPVPDQFGPCGAGDGDRGLFTSGFGRPVKMSSSNSGWSFKMKDFFVGDFHYRPPPPRPQALKPSHQALLGPAPGSHGYGSANGKLSSKLSGKWSSKPDKYSTEYIGPEPLITPFPAPPAPSAPPAQHAQHIPQTQTQQHLAQQQQQHFAHQQQQPQHFGQQQQQQQQQQYTGRPPAYQQAPPVYGQPLQPPAPQYSEHPHPTHQYGQPPQQATPAQPFSSSPYAQASHLAQPQPQPQAQLQAQPPVSPYAQPARPPAFSPTMNALAQQGGPSGYVNINSYAPHQQNGYTPGKINAGAFKPRPRGMEDDDDWQPGPEQGTQPVEWSQPIYGDQSQQFGQPPASAQFDAASPSNQNSGFQPGAWR